MVLKSRHISRASTSGSKGRRWVYSKPTLVLLLLVQPVLHVFSFVLLTEPCLNPHYQLSLSSKFDYLSLFTAGLIPETELKERFERAGVRVLFGTGVLQVWFVARLNSYCQKAESAALKQEKEVGSFIRQLESVSLTLLGLPFIIVLFYTLCVLTGAPIRQNKMPTLIIATQLSFLIGLPLIHILGLPPIDQPSSQSQNSSSSSNTTPPTTASNFYSTTQPSNIASTTSLPSPTKYWSNILSLNPNPTFILPLFYPPFFILLTTLLSTSVLALDWEVSYQTYPYPLLVGSLIGLTIGNLFTIFIVLFV